MPAGNVSRQRYRDIVPVRFPALHAVERRFRRLKVSIIRRYIAAYRQAPGARADAGLRRFIQQEIDQLLPFSLFGPFCTSPMV